MKFLRIIIFVFVTGFIFSSCQKEFTIEETTAKGSLQKDATGDCMPSLVNGVYAKDSLLKSLNFVDVTVNITQTGSYNVNTDTVNGYSFSAAGNAGIVGLNTIRLIGKGRPILGGIDIFKIKFDSSICEFNVIVSGTGGGGVVTPGNDSIVATIDGVYTTFKFKDSAKNDNTSAPGYNLLIVTGDNNSAGDENFTFVIGNMGPLTAGSTYTLNQFPASFVAADYVGAAFDYAAVPDPLTPVQTPGFSITISTLTATKVTGTFSGRLYENQGAGPLFKDVSGGIFSVTIYP